MSPPNHWLERRRVAIALLAALALSVLPAAAGGTNPATSTTTTSASTTTTSVPPSSTASTTTTTDAPATTVPWSPPPTQLPIDPAQLQSLLKGYDEAVADEAELLLEYELTEGHLDELGASLSGLEQQILAVENELLAAETELGRAESRALLADARLRDVEADLAEAGALLEEEAVEAYIGGGSAPAPALTARSIEQVETGRVYAAVVAEHTDSLIDRYAALRTDAERLRSEAARARQDAEEARDAVVEQRDALLWVRDEQSRTRLALEDTAAEQQALIDEANGRRSTYELRIRTLRTTSDSISSLLAKRQEGQRLPEETAAIFLPPVPDPVIVSSFGPRLHPIFHTVRMHNGTDIDASLGQPVRAAADGAVVMAEWRDGYGYTVVVDHGNGLATLYAHNAALIADVGDVVGMGDVLALAGSTGWSTGPHVHWEVRVFGNAVDPLEFMGDESLLDSP